MSSTLYGDAARSTLRASVACVDRALSQTPPDPALRAAWDDLVKVLALGPAPRTRECSRCHAVGMRGASRCGNCWTALDPLPDDPPPAKGDAVMIGPLREPGAAEAQHNHE